MPKHKLFCDCRKCKCKKCPDVLENLNITVTASRCIFNKAKRQDTVSATKVQCTSKIKGAPRKVHMQENCSATKEPKNKNKNMPQCSLKTETECLDCGIVLRTMKSHEPIDIGTRNEHDVKKIIDKARLEMTDVASRDTKSTKNCLKQTKKTTRGMKN